jgi:hypothetical protein
LINLPLTYQHKELVAFRTFLPDFIGMELLQVTPSQLRQAAVLKEKIVELKGELEAILGGAGSVAQGRKLHWSQTPAGRAKLARNARKRWRAQPRSSKASTQSTRGRKVHWTQTPAGRAKMARLMQARWDGRRKKAA